MIGMQAERRHDEASDDVDEASIESFPASDPPSFTPTHIGEPDEHPHQDPDPSEPDVPNPSPS